MLPNAIELCSGLVWFERVHHFRIFFMRVLESDQGLNFRGSNQSTYVFDHCSLECTDALFIGPIDHYIKAARNIG